jgi:two-component system nitrogen regulation sensor histidine kinase NtrY
MLGTLRQRLLALFFLVALVPSLGVTLFVTQYLSRSLAALRNPETERALGQSLEVIRQGIERLGSDAQHHATVMAVDADVTRLLAANRLADLERALRDAARERGLDYVCLYRVAPSRTGQTAARLFGARFGPRITIPEPEPGSLLAALNEGGLVSGGDAPRQVSGVAALGTDYLVLAGYQLDPEISAEIEALQKNLTMYRRLGVYTWLSQRSLWIFAGLWSLALGLLSFLLAALVSRGISRPVVALESAMERISAGDLSRRVTPGGTREVRFLGNAFNRMVDEIQTSRRALLRAERLAAWREVARAVAHEIRNPLTPIQFALQRLKDEARRAEAPRAQVIEESAEAILREVRSLQEFATAFSSVAQLPEPNPQPCDLVALAEDVARLYSGSTPVEFRVEAERPVPVAWADPGQMQRVLVNLIKNALDAMGPKGSIVLRVRRDATDGADAPSVALEVEDTGPGMDAATLDRAAHPGFTTKSTGSGLGLTLVQRIVEQHGGRFGLESSPGVGTRAIVTIPIAPDGSAPQGPA